jgi:hypothetical protein
MPYPKNLQTAVEVEAVVRDGGAIPATIAILDGVPHVGQFSLLRFFSYCCSWLPCQRHRLANPGFLNTTRVTIHHIIL